MQEQSVQRSGQRRSAAEVHVPGHGSAAGANGCGSRGGLTPNGSDGRVRGDLSLLRPDAEGSLILPSRAAWRAMLEASEDLAPLRSLQDAVAQLLDAARVRSSCAEQRTKVAEWLLRVKRRVGAALTRTAESRRGGPGCRTGTPPAQATTWTGKHVSCRRRCLARVPDAVFDSYLAAVRPGPELPSVLGALAFAAAAGFGCAWLRQLLPIESQKRERRGRRATREDRGEGPGGVPRSGYHPAGNAACLQAAGPPPACQCAQCRWREGARAAGDGARSTVSEEDWANLLAALLASGRGQDHQDDVQETLLCLLQCGSVDVAYLSRLTWAILWRRWVLGCQFEDIAVALPEPNNLAAAILREHDLVVLLKPQDLATLLMIARDGTRDVRSLARMARCSQAQVTICRARIREAMEKYPAWMQGIK